MTFHQGKVCQELNVLLSTYCETYCECFSVLLLKIIVNKLLFVMAQSTAINKKVLEHNINLLSVGSLCVSFP